MAVTKDLTIKQGKTFTLVLRWETEPIVRKAITGVSFISGAPRITAIGHGAPDGWRCAFYGIKGPKQLNAANNPPRSEDYHAATTIDADTVEMNEINPYDEEQGNELPAYVSGGFLQYNTPMDLTGYMARLAVKDKIGGTVQGAECLSVSLRQCQRNKVLRRSFKLNVSTGLRIDHEYARQSK